LDELPYPLWNHWHVHYEVLIGLSAIQLLYLVFVGPVRKRYDFADSVDPRQTLIFTSAILITLFSLVSPLHVLSDTYLFSAHMLQHVLLTLIVPPMFILGTPKWIFRKILLARYLFWLSRIFTNPFITFILFNMVFSLWHIPEMYNLSLSNRLVHISEHLMFIATATLMWWPITSPIPELPRLSYPFQMMYLFLLSIFQIVVFAPITFSNFPIYKLYADAPRVWSSISPLADQQIGGIIMKLSGSLIFITLIIVAFFRWFKNDDGQTKFQTNNHLKK